MNMQPNTQNLLAHTRCAKPDLRNGNANFDATVKVNFISNRIILTIEIDNHSHTIPNTIIKTPQDLFNWGAVNTKDNLTGKQNALYSAKQVTLKSDEQTPAMVDLNHYKYWLVIDGEGIVTIDAHKQRIKAQQAILLPPMSKCQLTNIQPTNLSLIQIQCRYGFNPKQHVLFKFNQ